MSVANTTSNQNGDSATSGAPADDTPVTPAGGAGLFDVDPDQDDVSQSPDSIITGDVDAFSIDVEP